MVREELTSGLTYALTGTKLPNINMEADPRYLSWVLSLMSIKNRIHL